MNQPFSALTSDKFAHVFASGLNRNVWTRIRGSGRLVTAKLRKKYGPKVWKITTSSSSCCFSRILCPAFCKGVTRKTKKKDAKKRLFLPQFHRSSSIFFSITTSQPCQLYIRHHHPGKRCLIEVLRPKNHQQLRPNDQFRGR